MAIRIWLVLALIAIGCAAHAQQGIHYDTTLIKAYTDPVLDTVVYTTHNIELKHPAATLRIFKTGAMYAIKNVEISIDLHDTARVSNELWRFTFTFRDGTHMDAYRIWFRSFDNVTDLEYGKGEGSIEAGTPDRLQQLLQKDIRTIHIDKGSTAVDLTLTRRQAAYFRKGLNAMVRL